MDNIPTDLELFANTDPVHKQFGEYYFWDETWSNEYGPYPTEDECRKALTTYSEQLNNSFSMGMIELVQLRIVHAVMQMYPILRDTQPWQAIKQLPEVNEFFSRYGDINKTRRNLKEIHDAAKQYKIATETNTIEESLLFKVIGKVNPKDYLSDPTKPGHLANALINDLRTLMQNLQTMRSGYLRPSPKVWDEVYRSLNTCLARIIRDVMPIDEIIKQRSSQRLEERKENDT